MDVRYSKHPKGNNNNKIVKKNNDFYLRNIYSV